MPDFQFMHPVGLVRSTCTLKVAKLSSDHAAEVPLPSPHRSPAPKTRWSVAVGVFVFVFLLCLASLTRWMSRPIEVPLPSVITQDEYDWARTAFRRKYGRTGDRYEVLFFLAEALLERQRPKEAVECLSLIPTSRPKYGRMSRFLQGWALLGLYRAVEAENHFREVISLEEASPTIKPEFVIQARQRLRHILDVELRFEERHRLLQGVIDRNEDHEFESAAACFPSLGTWNGPDAILWIEHFYAQNPESLDLKIALGRYRTSQGRLQEARQLLEEVVQECPRNLSAVAALIVCLRESDEIDELQQIFQKLPPQSRDDPWELLMQRGMNAIQEGKAEAAKAAFELLLEQDRTCAGAWHGLGQAAQLLGDMPLRKKSLDMGIALGRIRNNLGKTAQAANDPNSYLDIADLCSEVSLYREGAVMTRCAQRLAPTNKRVVAAVSLFRQRLADTHEEPLLGK